MTEMVVTAETIRHAKLQSNCQCQQTNSCDFWYRLMSKALTLQNIQLLSLTCMMQYVLLSTARCSG